MLEVVKVIEHEAQGVLLILDHEFAVGLDSELPDEGGQVASLAQEGGIAAGGQVRGKGGGVEGEAVSAAILSREMARPACSADRRGDERILEADAPSGQAVEVRSGYDLVPRAAHGPVRLVVGDDDNEIGRTIILRGAVHGGSAKNPDYGCREENKPGGPTDRVSDEVGNKVHSGGEAMTSCPAVERR